MSIKQIVKRGLTYIIKGTPIKKTVSEISYLSPSETLKGKKIIITGGGSGLGLAMARKFIQEKAEVLIAGRNETFFRSDGPAVAVSLPGACAFSGQSVDRVAESCGRGCGGVAVYTQAGGGKESQLLDKLSAD